MPTAGGKNVTSREAIQLIVKPITTKGIGSEDEKRLGMDLSDYFTAFEVTLANQTPETIHFSLSNILLSIAGEPGQTPLDENGSIQYYKDGDDPSRVILFPKSKKAVAKEIRLIRAARLTDGEVSPGGQKSGLILFKKVSQKRCREVGLTFEKIAVVRTGEEKQFSFTFSCHGKE